MGCVSCEARPGEIGLKRLQRSTRFYYFQVNSNGGEEERDRKSSRSPIWLNH